MEDLQSAQCLALSITIEGMVIVCHCLEIELDFDSKCILLQAESLKCSSNLEGSLEFVNPQLRSYRNSPALNLLKRFYQRLHSFPVSIEV